MSRRKAFRSILTPAPALLAVFLWSLAALPAPAQTQPDAAKSGARDVNWSGNRAEPTAAKEEYAAPAGKPAATASVSVATSTERHASAGPVPAPVLASAAAPVPDDAKNAEDAPETTATIPDEKSVPTQSTPPASAPNSASEPEPPSADPTSAIPDALAPPADGPATPVAAPPAASASPEVPASLPASLSPEAPPAAPAAPAPSFGDLVKSALDALLKSETRGAKTELRQEYAAVAAYYAARDYAPLWIENGKPIDAVATIMAQLAHAGDDGLDLAGPVPVFAGGDDELAAADVALSAEIVAYGRQASGSRVDPQTISGLIGSKPYLPDAALILAAVAAAGADGSTMLQSLNPQQKPYLALREKLIELRVETKSSSEPIPMGPSLRVGMSDPRVPLIRARFGLDAGPPGGSDELLYDTKVAAAVADFQKANGLQTSGVLTARTIATLGGASRIENEIIANMERWRWMPREMGDSRIEVNIPDFMATVVQDGDVVSRHRVIVGKPDTPTPVFSNTMKFLIVNPYWNVPPSIVRKEMLPAEAADPTYLSRMGFEVYTEHGRLVVRQPPGERNALGRIKFMFPNQYSVYLHDTPSRSLFAVTRRAFSHGCVRVDQPFGFAESVLGSRWPEAKIKRLIGGSERYVYLPKPLPIHIEYFTAYVDDAGRLQLRDDLYGYSHKVKQALGLETANEFRSARD